MQRVPHHEDETDGNLEPTSATGDTSDASRSARRSLLQTRWTVAAVLVLVGIGFYHRQIASTFRRAVASYHATGASQSLAQDDALAALASVNEALQWIPDDPALIYMRAQIRAQQEDWSLSLEDYDRLTNDLAPNFAQAYVQRAALHQRQSHFDQALSDIERAIDLSPDMSPVLLNHRAYLLALANRQLEDARHDINTAIDLYSQRTANLERTSGESAAMIDTRGFILYRQNEFEQAFQDFERALSLLSQKRAATLESLRSRKLPVGATMRTFAQMEGEILYHRGLTHRALGRLSEAENDFESATELGYDLFAEGL